MKIILTKILLLTSLIAFGQESTTIKVTVPNKTDEVFIVGNQESLGNWQPNKVKMNEISEYEREISLPLTFPIEFKFTRGSWESEAKILNQQLGTNIMLSEAESELNYQIEHWKDDKVEKGSFTLNYEFKYLPSKHYPNEERTLRIFLPKNYNPSEKYPVIYTLDGQTLFDLLVKNISILQDKTFDDNNIIPESIVVAIDNTNRGRDLTPNLGFNSNLPLENFLKGTEIFYEILNQEIVPFIGENYSTSGFNALIGHSDSGHFVTQLFLRDDNELDAIIALSVSDAGNYFQQKIPKKLKEEKSKLFFLGYGTMDDEFNELGYFLDKQNLSNENFLVKQYNANHLQLPFASLFDALKFIFSDYRFYDDLIENIYNNEFDYESFKNAYEKNIFEKYGIKTDIGYDIMYLLEKAKEKNNEFVFHKILDEIDRTKILQLQFRFWFSQEFNQNERAKNYLHQMLQSDDETDKLIFFSNLKDQYFDFYVNKIKQPNEFIDFIEKAKLKWPEYTLEFNYTILKTVFQTKIKYPKRKRYYDYCEKNFKKNGYFTKEDLNKYKP
jgi:predicted alpha/beta superfamily hydrolase